MRSDLLFRLLEAGFGVKAERQNIPEFVEISGGVMDRAASGDQAEELAKAYLLLRGIRGLEARSPDSDGIPSTRRAPGTRGVWA